MDDQQIRELARKAMSKRPGYVRLLRAKYAVVIGGMGVGAIALIQLAGLRLGLALVIAGAVGTAAGLAWNFVWVNTVLFRITREEVGSP
jgi:putative flippase GtrA